MGSIKEGLDTLKKAKWKTTSDYEKEGGPKVPGRKKTEADGRVAEMLSEASGQRSGPEMNIGPKMNRTSGRMDEYDKGVNAQKAFAADYENKPVSATYKKRW